MSSNTFTVDSGTTSVFLDLPTLESAAGITLVAADSTGEPFSEEFQVGFPIEPDTDFTFEVPFAPVSGSIEHSGTITLGVADAEVTVGDFSIGFDAARASDSASGFFVADTTEDALGLEVLFDISATGSLDADSDSLSIAERDLLIAPELAEALGATPLTGADVGDARIDASISGDSDSSSSVSTSSETATASSEEVVLATPSVETEVALPAPSAFGVESGTTSVFLDLDLLESAAGITLVAADSEGEPFSEDFQVGFSIEPDTDFTFEIPPFAPLGGSIEHSGTITLDVSGTEVTVGEFSIGFDADRVSDSNSGFFVADTTEDALGLEVLFDISATGGLDASDSSLSISERDLLIAPELAEALGAAPLTGADVGDARIDAAISEVTDEVMEDDSALLEATELINLLDADASTLDLSAESNAGFVNVGGFYQAIDAEGTVIDPDSGAEIAVGEEGYTAAAVANSVVEIGDGEAATLDLAGDFVYVPYLLADGEQFFSSFAEANPQGIDHVQSLSENTFNFEDLVGGGDLDFDDFILTVETV